MSFYVVLTDIGQAKLANAVALGTQIKITHLAVGDANGTQPNPDPSAKNLIHERYRAGVNRIDIDSKNPNWVVLEQVLPPDVGGWDIREIGAFDNEGNLIAYGNYPPTYKPLLNEGTSRTQTIRMIMQVSDAAAVTLKIDPSVVLATRQYVNDYKQKQDALIESSNKKVVHRDYIDTAGLDSDNSQKPYFKKSSTGELIYLTPSSLLKDGAYMVRSYAPLNMLAGSEDEVASTKQLVDLRNNTLNVDRFDCVTTVGFDHGNKNLPFFRHYKEDIIHLATAKQANIEVAGDQAYGRITYPNGFCEQWGRISYADICERLVFTVSFPISFSKIFGAVGIVDSTQKVLAVRRNLNEKSVLFDLYEFSAINVGGSIAWRAWGMI